MSNGQDDLDAWKRQRTHELAFEMADSGQYENFADIAYGLQFERGLTTAQALIDDPDMRRRLNERCGNAREALLSLKALEPLMETAETLAEAPDIPQTVTPATPSFLSRAALILWRSGARAVKVRTGDLNSAPS